MARRIFSARFIPGREGRGAGRKREEANDVERCGRKKKGERRKMFMEEGRTNKSAFFHKRKQREERSPSPCHILYIGTVL